MFDRSDMLILKAEGDLPDQQATWEIAEDRPLLLGRSADNDCSVPWDPRVSRRHARLTLNGEKLSICCLPQVSNLIWKSGSSCMETLLNPGDSFRIGQTRFAVSEPRKQAAVVDIVDDDPSAGKHTTSVMMSAADVRLAVVSRSAASLWTASTDPLLARKALDILQQVLSFANLFVVLSCDSSNPKARPQVVHWQTDGADDRPSVSRDLISQANTNASAAMQVDVDKNGAPCRSGRWAFCVPVRSDAETSWCIYIGGSS